MTIHPFEHKTLDIKTYGSLFKRCTRSNLLQSAGYGEAKCQTEGFEVIRKGILEDDKLVAIYQVLVKNLPLTGAVARLNRGPLILNDVFLYSEEKLSYLYQSLYNEWVVKNGFFLQIAPNLHDNNSSYEILLKIGFIFDTGDKWKSGWIDLDKSEEELRKRLQQKWRNMLNKAEKMEMELQVIKEKSGLEILLKEYERFMEVRSFRGVSSDLIRFMYSHSSDMIYAVNALKNNQLFGAIIIGLHGDTCTYLVGFTSDEGRKNNANYFLLWNGLLHCKNLGFSWFDVGGVDDIKTSGIAHFKQGLGIMNYRMVGEFEGRAGFRSHIISSVKNIIHTYKDREFLKRWR